MRIVILSDTHELHREIDLPAADLLIHAGDWTMFSGRLSAIEDFRDWLAEQHVRYGSILVPGNHEFYLEADPSRRSMTGQATVLIGERFSVQGMNFWGSPVTPLYGGAFGISTPEQRAEHYARIPLDTHVLITHTPPFGILDCPPGSSVHQGCKELLEAVQRVKPLLHVFGHVHGGYGVLETAETTFVNAALLGTHGSIANKPILLAMEGLNVPRGGRSA